MISIREADDREPVAERVLTERGLEWEWYWQDPPVGTKLFAFLPDAAGELRDCREELEFLRSVKESRGKELDEKDAEIERLTKERDEARDERIKVVMEDIERADSAAEIERLNAASNQEIARRCWLTARAILLDALAKEDKHNG
jgi:hypothetical protein